MHASYSPSMCTLYMAAPALRLTHGRGTLATPLAEEDRVSHLFKDTAKVFNFATTTSLQCSNTVQAKTKHAAQHGRGVGPSGSVIQITLDPQFHGIIGPNHQPIRGSE